MEDTSLKRIGLELTEIKFQTRNPLIERALSQLEQLDVFQKWKSGLRANRSGSRIFAFETEGGRFALAITSHYLKSATGTMNVTLSLFNGEAALREWLEKAQ